MEICAIRSLEGELRNLNLDPPTSISFGPVSEDDMFNWQAIIIGPVDTCLEGTLFHLSIHFPIDYPFRPPRVQFQNQICHPNVGQDGTVVLDILGEQWSPAISTEKLLLSISSILLNPVLEGIPNEFLDVCSDSNCYKKEPREWRKQPRRSCWQRIKSLLFLRTESYSCKSGNRGKASMCVPV